MKCPRCGSETPNDSERCVNCGVTFRRMNDTSPADKTVVGSSPDPARTSVTPQQTSHSEQTSHDDSPAADDTGSSDENELAMLREKLAGRYEIIRKLGAGGMASVYLAREIALDREVAIKLLPQAFVRDSKFTERFKNEARIAAGLEHPNIVRIYQIAEEGELVYFVMSYIPGGSLTERIETLGGLAVDDVVRWGMQVASALAYGHEKGVIHRDLKPDNIMLDRDGAAIVTDYGIARAGEGTGLTQTGAVVGTPQFMSPEQARGRDLDARSDIYAMGIMLYHMATGELPFQAADAASLMYMHVHETPEPPDALNADVPVWLRNIILRCLAKNPDDRFVNADELAQALAEKASPALKATPMKERRTSAGIPRWAYIGMVVALGIVIAGVGYWYQQQRRVAEAERLMQEQAAADMAREQKQQAAVQADDEAWEMASRIGTLESYRTYLFVHPDGSHVEAANEQIEALEAAAREEQVMLELPDEAVDVSAQLEAERRAAEERAEAGALARQDDLAYQNAEMVDTVRAYETYLSNNPAGAHADAARERITEIQTAETAAAEEAARAEAARDDRAFQAAETDGTRQGYNAYLISYPEGRHAGAARERIAAIDAADAETERIRVALSALSVRMVTVSAGTFLMGSEDGGDDERPVRTMTVGAFEMSATEVTQGLYREITGDNPSYFKLDENNPVERVSWHDAIRFCNLLSERIGLEPCYDATGACDPSKSGFRLPTEAEWEYACRAGSGGEYGLGDGESALDRMGWYRRNSGESTHPVGQKTSNAWGLSDMHGNVWEWCGDWYAENAYAAGNTDNPDGPASGRERVVRGGSYLDGPDDARSAKRRGFDPDRDYSDIGFRIVR